MPFTVNDAQDLTRVLTLHPEWLAEVRRLILTAELLALPDLVRELVEAQKQSGQRLDRLEVAVAELVEAQKQSGQRLDRLEVAVAELVEAQKRTEQQIKELVEAQKRSEYRLDRLEAAVTELAELQKRSEQRLDQMDGRLGNLRGRDLERKYRENVAAYFGRWLWPAQVVEFATLRDDLEQRLSQDQVEEVLLLDLVVRGAARRAPDKPQVWLAIEVSTVIDREDVARAHRRAALLRQAGYRAVPVVAGDAITLGAESEIRSAPIIVLRDGQSLGWEAALAVA